MTELPSLPKKYLFVEKTVNDVEEGALLGVKEDEEVLGDRACLVEAQDPGTAQYDKLGQNLEDYQSGREREREREHTTSTEHTVLYVWSLRQTDTTRTWCLWTGRHRSSC